MRGVSPAVCHLREPYRITPAKLRREGEVSVDLVPLDADPCSERRAERLRVSKAEDGQRVVRDVRGEGIDLALREEADAGRGVKRRTRTPTEAPQRKGLRVRLVLRLAGLGEPELALAEQHQPVRGPRSRADRASSTRAARRAGTDRRSRGRRASIRGRGPCAAGAAAALRREPRLRCPTESPSPWAQGAGARCRCARPAAARPHRPGAQAPARRQALPRRGR